VLKTFGYLVSTFSVIMLGIVAWKGASQEPSLQACLILGMATSIFGMLLRWLSHRRAERDRLGAAGQLANRNIPHP
jgi:hypothetical protein